MPTPLKTQNRISFSKSDILPTMVKKWLGAMWRGLRDWKTLLWPSISLVLIFYPDARIAIGNYFGVVMPEIPRLILICTALLIVIGFALWHRVVQLEERLDPKLSLDFDSQKSIFVHETAFYNSLTGQKVDDVLYVRLLPVCSASIGNACGRLSGVYKLERGEWKETAYDESLPLAWSSTGGSTAPITLRPGVKQCLDVFCITKNGAKITPCTYELKVPVRAMSAFDDGDCFRFDVIVFGDDNAQASISLKFQRGVEWNKPKIERIDAHPLASSKNS